MIDSLGFVTAAAWIWSRVGAGLVDVLPTPGWTIK